MISQVLIANDLEKNHCELDRMVFHLRSISKERLVKIISEITEEKLNKLKEGLDDILRY